MKKFFKFIFKLATLVGAGYGLYCLYNKYVAPKKEEDAEDDFSDDLDEFDFDDETEDEVHRAPEYVSLKNEDEQ